METLELRNQRKAKKPSFLRSDAHRVKGMDKKWHAPKGGDNKIRRKMRGHRRSAVIGWGSPRGAKGLSPEGFVQTVVYTEKDLTKVKGACILAGDLGKRKRILLLKKAQELKIKILNFKDSSQEIKKVEEYLKNRKEQEKSRLSKKEKSKQESLKKAEEKKKKAKEETPEEKEKRETEEKRKVLEQK